MYPYIHALFADRTGSVIFTCFGLWHILYLLLALAGVCLFCKFCTDKAKAARVCLYFAFGLYILDFFLMPFAYGSIDIEKLPFHACTAMCVMSFLSTRWDKLQKYQDQFALLGLISNGIYLVYPAGVGWYQIHPFCYRVVQTLMFHSLMTAFGIFYFVSRKDSFSFKNWKKELLVVCGQTVWALLGNTLYNGQAGKYDHFFNWFFVVRDPFYLLPERIAPWIMPFVLIITFFGLEMTIYWIVNLWRKRK